MAIAASVANGLCAASLLPRLHRPTAVGNFKSTWATFSSPSPVTLHGNKRSFTVGSSTKDDYLGQATNLMKSDDNGPPRWFSPLECGCRSTGSPLLLFLPGIDGSGLGLMLHHKKLGEIFDIWCLHIPAADRTPLAELVMLVENIVRTEQDHSAKRPIYLVGESLGASLALLVSAHNPDTDFILILCRE